MHTGAQTCKLCVCVFLTCFTWIEIIVKGTLSSCFTQCRDSLCCRKLCYLPVCARSVMQLFATTIFTMWNSCSGVNKQPVPLDTGFAFTIMWKTLDWFYSGDRPSSLQYILLKQYQSCTALTEMRHSDQMRIESTPRPPRRGSHTTR